MNMELITLQSKIDNFIEKATIMKSKLDQIEHEISTLLKQETELLQKDGLSLNLNTSS